MGKRVTSKKASKKGGGQKISRAKARKMKARQLIEGRKAEFHYYGHTLEELQAMTMDELSAVVPARFRRTIKRGFTEEQKKFLHRLDRQPDRVLRTHLRNMIVLPKMVGRTLKVYNGKDFVELKISEEMIGHYLGEFVLTRRSVKHSGPGVGATRSSKYMPLK